MTEKRETISEALRRALTQTPVSLTTIERETGVHRSVLSRFLNGETSLRVDVVDRVAQFLGLTLQVDLKESPLLRPRRGKEMHSTDAAYVNRNDQENLANTGHPRNTHPQH